jgi:hypothetical protein
VGSIWLHGRTGGYPNLVDVLRAGGVDVATYAGWETRSRSSGGFEGLWGVVCHHTASKTTPANDLAYMVNADDGPISSGLLDRDGRFTVIAAGAANHAGKGGGSSDGGGTPWRTARGTIPANDANRYAFGIEAANDGIGEPWPTAQQDAYVKMCRALADGYGFVVATDYRSHAEWTPPRKIDPRGPARWQPANTSQPWDMNGFRADVEAAASGGEQDMTNDQAAQLAAVYAAITQPISPGVFVDPNGTPVNVPWAVGYTWNQLQELSKLLTGPIYPDYFVDDGGTPVNLPWAAGYAWQRLQQTVTPQLAEIIDRLERLESQTG